MQAKWKVYLLTLITYAVIHSGRTTWASIKIFLTKEPYEFSPAFLGSIDLTVYFVLAISLNAFGSYAETLGPKRFILLGMTGLIGVSLAVGALLLFQAKQEWLYFILYGVVFGVASCVGWPSCLYAISRHFTQKDSTWLSAWNGSSQLGDIISLLVFFIFVSHEQYQPFVLFFIFASLLLLIAAAWFLFPASILIPPFQQEPPLQFKFTTNQSPSLPQQLQIHPIQQPIISKANLQLLPNLLTNNPMTFILQKKEHSIHIQELNKQNNTNEYNNNQDNINKESLSLNLKKEISLIQNNMKKNQEFQDQQVKGQIISKSLNQEIQNKQIRDNLKADRKTEIRGQETNEQNNIEKSKVVKNSLKNNNLQKEASVIDEMESDRMLKKEEEEKTCKGKTARWWKMWFIPGVAPYVLAVGFLKSVNAVIVSWMLFYLITVESEDMAAMLTIMWMGSVFLGGVITLKLNPSLDKRVFVAQLSLCTLLFLLLKQFSLNPSDAVIAITTIICGLSYGGPYNLISTVIPLILANRTDVACIPGAKSMIIGLMEGFGLFISGIFLIIVPALGVSKIHFVASFLCALSTFLFLFEIYREQKAVKSPSVLTSCNPV